MNTQRKPQLRKNVAGFFVGGQFHPIRSGVEIRRSKTGAKVTKKAKTAYDAGLAGDYDFPAERDERRAANRDKADANLRKQLENEIRRDMFGDGETVGKSLLQFVRKSGGIKPSYTKTGKNYDAGELSGLTFKQSKKRGLVSEKSKYTLDGMYQNAREAGYDIADENDLIDRLDDEIRKGKKTFATHGYLDYRDNPAKKRMATKGKTAAAKPKLTAAQIKTTAANLAKLYPNSNAKQILAKVKKNPSTTSPKTASRSGAARKNPVAIETKTNGVLSRWNNRRKAKRQLGKTLRHKAAASRAQKKQSEYEAKALTNPARKTATRRKSVSQPSLSFKPSGFVPAFKIELADLKKPKYANLQHEGRDGNDTYYVDALTGNRYLTRENPATVQKVNDYWQVRVGSRQYLKDAAGRIWKSRSKKQALELAAKTKTDSAAELSWLNSLRTNPANYKAAVDSNLRLKAQNFLYANGFDKLAANVQQGKPIETQLRLALPFLNKSLQGNVKKFIGDLKRRKNPAAFLPAFANAAVGIASTLQIHDHLTRPAKKTRTVKKPAARKNPIVKKNPVKKNPVKVPTRKAFEMFRGRPADSMKPMLKSKHAPNHLDALGDLVEIVLDNGEVLNFERVRNGKAHYPFALTMNGGATRLWIAGGKFAKANPSLQPHQLDIIARIEDIVYAADKPHIEGDEVVRHYIHALGEETGDKPYLAIDNLGYPVIYLGAYTIEWRGIVN